MARGLRWEDLDPATRERARAAGVEGIPDEPAPPPADEPAGEPAGRPRRRTSPLDRVPQGTSATDAGARFILGLIVWALVRSYLQGGVAGMKQWMAAKFLNADAKSSGG